MSLTTPVLTYVYKTYALPPAGGLNKADLFTTITQTCRLVRELELSMQNLLPCVGFELQYSPLQRDSVENLAHSLTLATSEFTFDVFQAVEPGRDILMLFANKQTPTQQILAEVVNCVRLDDAHYRLTLKTLPDSCVLIDKGELICLPINEGPATAQEMTLQCPACKNTSPFRFIATQEGDWDNGILPIYNCAACGTTRAMIGLVNRNDQISETI